MPKRLPIKAAKDLSEAYQQDQVIVMTWDATEGLMHVVSYGKTLADCEAAAKGANLLKTALGFPEYLCKTEPRRGKKASAK